MIIKKYIVNDMKEAMVRAKYELGGDAVIISQKAIKIGKWYNPFKISKLEVTMALEEQVVVRQTVEEKPISKQGEKLRRNTGCSLVDAINQDPMYENASEKIKGQLLNYCKLHGKTDHYLSSDELRDFLDVALKGNCFESRLGLSKINVMIGPTGVGKTTTIAKIAAREHLLNGKKVGLITMDTYRIGAVEQLKTYANILNLPFEVVNEPNEMEEKVRKLGDCDIILIDTLGTSPKNQSKLIEIKEYFKTFEEMNTYLVLSMATDKDTTLNILERYKQLSYDALILTKLDEGNILKNFWNVIENNSLPVQFLCNGQDVPDDILDATLDNLIKCHEVNYEDI